MMFGWTSQILNMGLAIVFIILITLSALKATAIVLKTQVLSLVSVGLSIVALLMGANWAEPVVVENGNYLSEGVDGFWAVFAVFFPAVTGILTGLSLSGDLKDEKDIPYGTMGAVLVGLVIYMIIPLWLIIKIPLH